MVGAGLDALEIDFPKVTKRHRRFLIERAREYDLLETAGSDYHGDSANGRIGGKVVPRATVEALRKKANRSQSTPTP